MQLRTAGIILILAVGFSALYPWPDDKPSTCETQKCLSTKASISGCDESGRRSIGITVNNIASDASMDYRFDYDSRVLEIQGNHWAQVLKAGESRRHTFLTVPGVAGQATIVAKQMSDSDFQESHVVKPC